MLRRVFFSIFFLFCSLQATISPSEQLTSGDVQKQMKILLASHVTYNELNQEIVQRMMLNFLELLDPTKLYMMEPEISKWTHPEEQQLDLVLQELKKGSYRTFFTIYDYMVHAIQRRNDFESKIDEQELPEVVDNKELKNIEWCSSEKMLMDRLSMVRSLQKKAAKDLNEKDFLLLATRRRLNREKTILGTSENDRTQEMHQTLLKAFASSLDAYTNYFTPKEARSLKIHLEQRLEGIGAQLQEAVNGLKIDRIIPSGPAEKSHALKAGDLIVAVNNEPIIGMDLSDAVELIRGKKGTKVQLTILRETEEQKQTKLEIDIIRDEIFLEESRIKSSIIPFGDGVIAHIHLMSFYQDPSRSSSKDIQKTLEEIAEKNMIKGIILDVRNNGGGQIQQAVEVAGLFVSKGIMVSVQYPDGFIQHIRNFNGKILSDKPLIVLTNRITASAAEIVAGTLQDYKRALVVGDSKTFGKGSFQNCTINMNPNSSINSLGEYKVTRGLYYTVSGKSPQLRGVTPDICVPGIYSALKIGEEYNKYPLQVSSISSNFEDTLNDIPQEHKNEFILLYKHNLQKILTMYDAYLPLLEKNSQERLTTNEAYQQLLEETKKEEYNYDKVSQLNQTDLQLSETVNIMRDLIYAKEMSEAANF
ncbi:MAG: PDZ domain-containing protein [Parachlamydiales bacterium]|nr:PDZ domain-containing protein [Parachlamydiales bacterium]